MIVRRYDAKTGEEVNPVTVVQAMHAIAECHADRIDMPVIFSSDVYAIETGLLNGCRYETDEYLYVPEHETK